MKLNAAVLIVTLATVLSSCAQGLRINENHNSTASSLTSPTPDAAAPGQQKAAFLGDSLVQGAFGEGTRFTAVIAEIRGWYEINLGRAGTGYHTSINEKSRAKSVCGEDYCPSFYEMTTRAIATKPDIVIISGGENDFETIENVSLQMFKDLRAALPKAKIYVLEPLWQAKPYPPYLKTMSVMLKENAEEAGVNYIDLDQPLSDCPACFADDGVHPNAKGYEKLGKIIEAKLPKN